MARSRNPVVSAARALWRGVDFSRRVALNILFLIIVVALFALLLQDNTPKVPDQAALVVKPVGTLVDQLAGNPMDRAIAKVTGNDQPETLLRDVVDGIRLAKDDDRIEVLFLDLNSMGGAGLSKLQEVSEAIAEFKATGKSVIASADDYSNSSYYLAAQADEVYMHHMGAVFLDGYGRFRTYYKEGLDRLEVDWNVFKVGEYKSAVEPYLRNEMSDEAREANIEWMGDLWRQHVAEMAAARGMTGAKLESWIDQLPDKVMAASGDIAEVALEAGLIDKIGGRDTIRDRMIELLGEDDDGKSFPAIGLGSYLETVDESDRPSLHKGGKSNGQVAVVVARGSIQDGSHPPGTIGGDSTARLIRQARKDDDVKAVVLRVDSGGGSAFASEVIRRECALTRAEGKPVVVSMGSVAASGGYWISTASDEIWASPSTITGSIGIFGMFPTYQKPLAKHLGMRVDGVGTTRMAGAMRPDREMQAEVGQLIQEVINQGYSRFLDRVSEARGMPTEEVDKIARGRVWSGEDAHSLGLVDKLGGLDEAIASAAVLAELEDAYEVTYVEPEMDFEEKLLLGFLTRAASWLPERLDRGTPDLQTRFVRFMEREMRMLSELNDPHGVYAHCLCEIE